MQLTCDVSIAAGYKSASQQARVISEHWFNSNAYCLACKSESLAQTRANMIATDFICASCGHRYELKTFCRRPRKSILDGAYATFISRVRAGSTPTLCLLERNEDWRVRALTAIHSSLITELAVERRTALAPNAQRAGYIGCKIRLDRIPPDGEITLIKDGVEQSKTTIRREFQRYLPLSGLTSERRGWTALTLGILRRFPSSDFRLSDVYAHEKDFSAAYPNNRHVREKIRQQLQTLRDIGVVEFCGDGSYSMRS